MDNSLKFDYSDIVLVPKAQTNISHREQCDPYVIFGHNAIDINTLPLIASPMDTVVSNKNYKEFIRNDIIPSIPRGQYAFDHYVDNKQYFQSFGLCEIENTLKYLNSTSQPVNKNHFFNYHNILIDTANGHMSKIVDIIKKIKKEFPKIIIMVGNIANPETFKILGEAGANYVRCSIGTGAGCTTAANVGVNYPLGSLISECRKIKDAHGSLKDVKIVADGGIQNYSDAIKALCLGSDYVMIGNLFNKSIESAGFNYLYGVKINNKLAKLLWRYNFPIKKKYRGMSIKAVQRSWGKSKLVTAEGITKYQKVEYTLNQWTENFKDYLKSAMSYSGAKTLQEFIGNSEICQITKNAYDRFNK